jgi:hypothetical protein
VTIGALSLWLLTAAGCNRSAPPYEPPLSTSAPPPAIARETRAESQPRRDLSTDEARGGHTLARHVGKTDEELRDRLRRESDISSASTYTDRATAEAVVGAALASGGRSFDAWRSRLGRRPNFVLHFDAGHVIGRSMGRRRTEATPCEDVLVVLRWDERRERFYVLTSYPEVRR